MNAAAARTADRRFLILKFTATGNGTANTHMLPNFLSDLGHPVSMSLIKNDIIGLEELGLLETTGEYHGMVMFKVTDRGSDVAAGRARAAGVREPRPDER